MNKFVIISSFNAKDTREERISIFIRDDGKESVHFPVFMEFRIHRNFSFYLQQARAAIRSFAIRVLENQNYARFSLAFQYELFKILIRHRKFNASTIAPICFSPFPSRLYKCRNIR